LSGISSVRTTAEADTSLRLRSCSGPSSSAQASDRLHAVPLEDAFQPGQAKPSACWPWRSAPRERRWALLPIACVQPVSAFETRCSYPVIGLRRFPLFGEGPFVAIFSPLHNCTSFQSVRTADVFLLDVANYVQARRFPLGRLGDLLNRSAQG
jgi:hypothetical protein